jgi:5-formyltetrahydrofolate cyclo-ligase
LLSLSSKRLFAMKTELRKQMLAVRDALDPGERLRLSEAIAHEVMSQAEFKAAATVMAYMTFGSEFVTQGLINTVLAVSKTLVLPRVDRTKNRLELYEVRDLDHDLTSGPWGIREPTTRVCREIALHSVDFIVVPGLGFTARGDRLGYGRGYYDRLLVNRESRTRLVAPAFSVQMMKSIPASNHDIAVDVVITELQTYQRTSFKPG